MTDWTYIDDPIERRADQASGGENGRRPGLPTGDEAAPALRGGADTVWHLGSIVANRFVLRTHLGRGRYGEVYEALDRSLSDPQMGQEHSVALHLLHDRVREQTRLLQKLEGAYLQPHVWAHPNVVKISGFGCDRDKYFLVMELLEGASLRFILDENSPELLSHEEAFAVLRGVGDALKYAHAKGAIHGEIRPEKIFITSEFVVKVLDLLPASSPRTVPFYVEDAAAQGAVATADPRDDVYGLACLAYELLSGRHPFNANSPLEAAQAGLMPGPIDGIERWRWDALAGGLALRREQRTDSIAQFLRELGITGSEKLRSSKSPTSAAAEPPPAVQQDLSIPVVGDYSMPASFTQVRSPAAPSAQPQAERPMPSQTRGYDFDPYPPFPQRRERPKPRSAMRLVVLALVAAIGVAAYLNYELLRGRAADLVAAAAAFAGDGAARSVAEPDGGPASAGRSATQAPVSVTTDPVAEVAGDAPVVEERASASGNAPSIGEQPLVAGGAPAVEQPGSIASAAPRLENAAPVAGDSLPVAAAVPEPSGVSAARGVGASGPARFAFATGRVTITEGQAIAAVTIRRIGGSLDPAAVVWWASDGTATGDDDYANFGRRVENFAAGEEARTIHIPIVVDSVAESTESFYLNLGESRQPGRRLEPAEQIEIVIRDDDA
jgi:serine/threonine protein kinase